MSATPKPKLTLSQRLMRLVDDIYKDDCFSAPEPWEIDEMAYLIKQAADQLKAQEDKPCN